jgi:predicted secreted Zn-dependent protease
MITGLMLVLALQQPQAALADLPPQVTLRPYVVEGRNPRQVRAAVEQHRPVSAAGRPHDSMTTWTYRVRWMTDGAGACLPETAEVTSAVVVTVPELGEGAQLAPRARERWDAWTDYLATHERRRVDLVLAGFEAMQSQIRAAPDCAAMTARQAEAVAAINQQSQALDTTAAEQFRRNPRSVPTFP